MAYDVTIVAEPGLPHELSGRSRQSIADDLESLLDDEVDLSVQTGALTLDPDGNVHLSGSMSRSRTDSSIIIFITELPRLEGGRPAPLELDNERSAAIVSVPACGTVTLRRRVARLIVAAVAGLTGSENGEGALEDIATRRRRWLDDEERPGKRILVAGSSLGWQRQILGMTRVNRPWRLVSTLKGVMAAAAATASFGIFYTSIWSMSDAMGIWRLAMVTMLSVVVMTAWLIIANKLWEPEKRRAYGKVWSRLYNASTVMTVLVGVVTMYVSLFVLSLLAGLVVIDPGYMSKQLPHSATFTNFVRLSWLTTSMGVIAGALGSSADSYDAILRATYGNRERERRMSEDAQEEDEQEDAQEDAQEDEQGDGAQEEGANKGGAQDPGQHGDGEARARR